jgi:hypothetical protein
MNHPSGLRKVWLRRSLRALPVLVVVTCALGLDLRHRASRRLSSAQTDFAAAFGSDQLARVRTSLSRPPELVRRMNEVSPFVLSVDERRQLVRLAAANASPDGLAPWLARCERLLAVLERARSSPAAVAEVAPWWAELKSLNRSLGAINSLRACGLAAQARGERTLAISAAELLGAFARSLETWPLRLSLMVGYHAELAQLDLIGRMSAGGDADERRRLLGALSGEDLRARHRDAIAGEMLYAANAWRTWQHNEAAPVFWYLGPFEAGAHIRDLTRYLKGDRRPPSWPDSSFVTSKGQRMALEGEKYRQARLSERRDAERRRLAL